MSIGARLSVRFTLALDTDDREGWGNIASHDASGLSKIYSLGLCLNLLPAALMRVAENALGICETDGTSY